MSQKTFLMIAGVIFLLISLGHLLRVVFAVTFVVADIGVPMWASVLAVVVMGYLAWQGLRLASKSRSEP